MRRLRTIGLALVVVFALSAMVASAAQAVTAPFFTVGGTRLVAGKTHNIDARAAGSFVLTTPALGVTITCTSLNVLKGVLLGSNAGQPGKDNEINVFSGCTVTGAGANCKVVQPIETKPLVSELVEIDGTKEALGEEFKPASGTEFVGLKFEGSECLIKETPVTGQVVAQIVTDNTAEEAIELGQTAKQATSWKLKFPEPAITKILLINTKGESQTVTVETFEALGFASTLTGTALTLLANTKFEPERTATWSPLP